MQQSLVLSGVTKKYSADVTIGPASFEVQKGEFFSLLGPSGCGKTTILRAIAGFERVTGGEITLNGERIQDRPAHRRNIGLVFQSYALFPHLTIFENVAFGLRLRKVPPRELAARVEKALALVGMPDLGSRFPAQISGGQQQRVAIARAVVLEPALILFDEPLSNLDQKLRVQLRTELKDLQRRLGMTSIFVTHDQSEALALSNRIAVLSSGKIEQIGSPVEIYERPATVFVADFIGSANLFDAADVAPHGSGLVARLLDGTTLRSSIETGTPGSRARVLVRPEHLVLVANEDDARAFDNVLHGTLTDTTYLGEDLHLRIKVMDRTDWHLAMKGGERARHFQVGQPITVGVQAHNVYVLAG